MSNLFSIAFVMAAVAAGAPLLFGTLGEILTEKSGNLNLGIPGIMYVGGICGVIGAFFYEQAVPADQMSGFLAILIPMLCSLLGSLLMGLLYCFLTVRMDTLLSSTHAMSLRLSKTILATLSASGFPGEISCRSAAAFFALVHETGTLQQTRISTAKESASFPVYCVPAIAFLAIDWTKARYRRSSSGI